ncbi:hypothetical protein T03_6179, partial [Trichinella britovi]
LIKLILLKIFPLPALVINTSSVGIIEFLVYVEMPNEITVPLSSSLFTHIYNLCTNQANITRLFIKLFTLCPYTINKID